jgi:PCI domain
LTTTAVVAVRRPFLLFLHCRRAVLPVLLLTPPPPHPTHNIQLEGTDEQAWLDALRLFAYGTYTEYKASTTKYPTLSPQQIRKLKQLTIVDLASQHKTLSYKQLMQTLDVSSVRELEDLIIDCLYAEMLHGRLNQKDGILNVDYAIGRDIGPDDVASMGSVLDQWLESSETLLQQLDKQKRKANDEFSQRLTEAKLLIERQAEAEVTVRNQRAKEAQDRQSNSIAGAFVEFGAAALGLTTSSSSAAADTSSTGDELRSRRR